MKKIVEYGIDEKTDKAMKIREKLRKLFDKEVSRWGDINFEEGSEREKEFIDYVTKKRINVYRKGVFVSCTRSEITKLPYFYLSLKADRKYGQESAFDMSTACKGWKDPNSFGCENGIKQIKKLTINPKKSKNLDITTVTWFLNPMFYVVSRRLKYLLEEHKATGCKFIPCLKWGEEYPDELTLLDRPDENLAERADYFQMIITDSVISPPSIGNITLRKPHACPYCGTYFSFTPERRLPIFSMDDLRETDFQVYNQFKTTNMEIIRISVEVSIVSSRILDLMLKSKMKGILRYLTDPPIPYGVVEIHGVTPE